MIRCGAEARLLVPIGEYPAGTEVFVVAIRDAETCEVEVRGEVEAHRRKRLVVNVGALGPSGLRRHS